VSRVAKFEKADETIPFCLIGLNRPSDSYYDEADKYGMRFNSPASDFGHLHGVLDGEEVYTVVRIQA